MIPFAICAACLLLQTPAAPPGNVTATSRARASAESSGASLLNVKRIFVEDFGDDIVSRQVQAMLVTTFTESKRFVITEKREKADAFLKGTALEKSSQEVHEYSEGTAIRQAAIHDSSVSTKVVTDASVSVRLVNQDGDVIWTSTQESRGAKYKGSSADVADKIVKQLMRDVERIEKSQNAPGAEKAAQ